VSRRKPRPALPHVWAAPRAPEPGDGLAGRVLMQVLSATSFDVLGNCTKYLTLAFSIFLLGSQASAAGIVGVLIALTGGAIYSPAGEASACLPPRKALCLPARCTGAAPSVSRLARIRARLPQAEACVPHPTE
jgi:hypothetical protein